jgi:hypothetical protein
LIQAWARPSIIGAGRLPEATARRIVIITWQRPRVEVRVGPSARLGTLVVARGIDQGL